MAVIGIAQEKITSREKRETMDERSYRRLYIVKTNNHEDDGIVVDEAFGIPRIGQHYVTETSHDPKALCHSRRCTPLTPLVWQVDCEYSTKESKLDPSTIEVDFDLVNYEWSTITVKEVVTGQSTFELYGGIQSQNPDQYILKDSTGILNSAYEPFNPPAEIDRHIPVLTVKRREKRFDHRIMLAYVNSVNKFAYWRWAPRCIKLASIKATIVYEQDSTTLIKYWDVTYTFHFNIYTWDLFLLDIGSYYFEGGIGTTPLTKKPGMVKGVPGLVLLTSDGDKSTSVSHYKRFRVLHELDYGPLMIAMVS
jgi:hypothetical protein